MLDPPIMTSLFAMQFRIIVSSFDMSSFLRPHFYFQSEFAFVLHFHSMKILWFILWSLVGASSPHSRIPFRIDETTGNLVVNSTRTDTEAFCALVLSPLAETRFPHEGLVLEAEIPENAFVLTGNELRPFILDSSHVLGIGPHGGLVRTFESVSIQKQSLTSGVMVIGEPTMADGFITSCLPESILRVGLGSLGNTFRGRLNSDVTVFEFILSNSPSILSVPNSIFDTIVHAFEISGGARMINETFFENCTDHVIAQLPNISIIFANGGSLVLAGQDYIYRDHDETCILKLSRVSPREYLHRSLRFNPLMIPQMNVRFTFRFMELCDSLA